jgi:hypothetical protein
VVGEAAARTGMSAGACVGDTAVGRARAKAARAGADEAGGVGKAVPSSWRELVAALVALHAEAATLRPAPVVEPKPVAPGGELLTTRRKQADQRYGRLVEPQRDQLHRT